MIMKIIKFFKSFYKEFKEVDKELKKLLYGLFFILVPYIIGSISKNKIIILSTLILFIIGFLIEMYIVWSIIKPDIIKFLDKVKKNM